MLTTDDFATKPDTEMKIAKAMIKNEEHLTSTKLLNFLREQIKNDLKDI